MSSETRFQLLNLQCQVQVDAPKFASVSFCWSKLFIAHYLSKMTLETLSILKQSYYVPCIFQPGIQTTDHTMYRQTNPFSSYLTKESGANCMNIAQVRK